MPTEDQPQLFPSPPEPDFPPPWDRRLLYQALTLIGHGNAAAGKVFCFVWDQGMKGATCDEVEAGTGMVHQTCSARFNELKGSRGSYLLKPSGKHRKTRNGGDAEVFVAHVEAIELLATSRNLLVQR